jgi:hypothetical protein
MTEWASTWAMGARSQDWAWLRRSGGAPIVVAGRSSRQRDEQGVVKQTEKTKAGGEGGIRTRGTLAGTHDFQSCTFGHSVTSPGARASQFVVRGLHASAGKGRRAQGYLDGASAARHSAREATQPVCGIRSVRQGVEGPKPCPSLPSAGEHEDSELRRRSRRARAPAVPLRVHMISNHAPSATRSPLLALGPRNSLFEDSTHRLEKADARRDTSTALVLTRRK